MIEISRTDAQNFILSVQGIKSKDNFTSIIDVVKNIHNVQIDTISVVARSHDLTIFNRYPKYSEKDVWNLLEKKQLFEYWSHAICFLPYEEYPFYAWKMKNQEENLDRFWKKWITENKSIIRKTLDYIKKNGETCSADFQREDKKKSQGWWDWKKEKIALEYLFYIGKLMISYRKNFQRYYDLPEKVLPSNINTEPMNDNEIPEYIIRVISQSLGIISINEIKTYLGRLPSKILWQNNRKKILRYFR